MKKQRTCLWSVIPRAILVLGVISMFSTWLPNQASADDYNDEQPQMVGDQYAYAKINQLKSFGWQVQSNEAANGTVSFTATKTDPKTEESTVATYNYNADSYTSNVEHTFKDGSKTSESTKGNDEWDNRGGKVIRAASETKVSSSTTDPAGNQTTKVYDGGKVAFTSQFDSRFNTTTTTNVQTGNKTITTPNSERIIGPTGKNIFDYERANDGTTTTWSFDANGNTTGRVINKPDGTITRTQKVADGSFASVTTDSKGTVISKQFCDVPSNCVAPTNNQNPQNGTAQNAPPGQGGTAPNQLAAPGGNAHNLAAVQARSGKRAGDTLIVHKPTPDGGREIVTSKLVDGQFKKTSDTFENASGTKSTKNFDPSTGNITSTSWTDPSGVTTTHTYAPGCQNMTGAGCQQVSRQSTDPQTGKTSTWKYNQDGSGAMTKIDPTTGKMTTINFDKNGNNIGTPQVSNIPPTVKPQAQAGPQPNQKSLAGATPKSLVGNNSSPKKPHGRHRSKASSKKPGLAGANKEIRASILNEIGSKGISKGVKEGITADVAKGIGSESLAVSKSQPDSKYSLGKKYQPKGKFTKYSNATSKFLNSNSSARSKGTAKPYRYSEGNQYKPKNAFTKTYNATPKSPTWNSSAGSKGTVKHKPYRKFR